MPNSENNDSGGIRSQMESDKQTKQDLEESLREIGTAIEELSRKVEESKPTVVAEEVRQKADHLETKAEEINTALIKLQSQGVPMEEKETFEEMTRKIDRFLNALGPMQKLGQLKTEVAKQVEQEIVDQKKAWVKARKKIQKDVTLRKTVTDDLNSTWWLVAKASSVTAIGMMILMASIWMGLVWLGGVPILPEKARMTPEERELIEDGKAAKAAFQGLEGEEFERLQDLWSQGIENSQAQGQE